MGVIDKDGRSVPPWDAEQVRSLNAYQAAGVMHPFTSMSGTDLIATTDGWIERDGGPVVQTWAHAWMADWSWKETFPGLGG